MPTRNALLWGIAIAAGVLAACGDKAPDKPKVLAIGGPAAPELTWGESKERAERAPISLTASDGSGLALLSVEARAVIEDPLAFTELHLRFYNPESRRREGRFEIALPPTAAISRFAMRVGDRFQEGEVVERKRAQQVYEDFLHRKQDPALLEKNAGNQFSARVFPIEPNAEKEIVIAYSEELTRHDDPYVLLLKGLPKLNQIKVEITVGSNSATGLAATERVRGATHKLTLTEHDYAPDADLEVHLPWQKALALRSGDRVVARVAPQLTLPAEPIAGLTVLFDTSGSRALGFGAQIERLGGLISALSAKAGDFELRVVAFDQVSEETYRGKASGFGLREQSRLLERDALGATDLAQALAFIARDATAQPRVLVVGDGVVTAGAQDTTTLREAVAKLAAHGVRRLDVLAENGIADREALALLTRAGLPSAGVVLDASAPLAQLVDKLSLGTRDRVQVQIAGATFVYPRVLEGLQPGDERLIYAELPSGAPLQVELVGAGAQALPSMEAPQPLLERACARARIEALTAALHALPAAATDERGEREREIVALSLAQRVVSDYTALLVLEGPSDYQRFGIEQTALTRILSVGDEGIELLDRKSIPEVEIEPPREEVQAEPDMQIAAEPPATGAPNEGQAMHGAAPTTASRARGLQPEPETKAKAEFADKAAPGIGSLAKGSGSGADLDRVANARPASAPAPAPASPKKDSMAQAEAELAPQSAVERSGRALDDGALGTSGGERRGGGGSPAASTGGAPMQVTAPTSLAAHAEVRLHSASGIPSSGAASVLRGALRARAQQCYERAIERGASERLTLAIDLNDKGTVADAYVTSGSLADKRAQSCIVAAARALRFPKPEGAMASLQAGIELSLAPAAHAPAIASLASLAAKPSGPRKPARIARPALEDAYDGVLAEVLGAIARGENANALQRAQAAHAADPGDVIGLVALGEALEAQSDYARAARAYGSLIDLFPSRTDLRRMAAERLERLPREIGAELAADSYRIAVDQRPDHPSGQRALAYALWKIGAHQAALDAIGRALDRGYPSDRFDGVDRILREDLALIGAAYIRAEPDAEPAVRAALAARGVEPEHAPSLRFVLSWETDANDVDFHIYDGRGGHAFYMKPKLASGGALYADITTGYGPECFAIAGQARNYPYVLQAHYYARGPMGYGMGKLQVIDHDGRGGLVISEHPFAIMKDKAFVELARLEAPARTPKPGNAAMR